MDSRFHLKVVFEVYGDKFEWSPSLNWSAEPGQCDERITSWFADCYEKAYGKFQDSLIDEQLEKKSQQEIDERALLARLQQKYPDA